MTATPAHIAGCYRRWQRARQRVAPTAMSADAVSQALGVGITRVGEWIALGWIDARRAGGHGYAITEAALRQFLAERGALIRGLRPNRRWAVLVRAARADLEARYIDTASVAALLHVHVDTIHRQRRYGFPPPSVRVGSRNGGDWYDRAAVRAWLAANPRYLTTAARKEFEL